MKLTLPILYHTDNSYLLKELGVDNSDYEAKNVIFYRIDAIKAYDDSEYQTTIYANNDNFICDLPIDKVEALIDNARLK